MLVSELSFPDLQRLRAIVKKVHMQYYPVETYTDREADRIIESYGRETAERMIQRAVDQEKL